VLRRSRIAFGDQPSPTQLWRPEARALFENAPDDLAIGEHVIVFVLPLAGAAGDGGAFESEAGHFAARADCESDRPLAPFDLARVGAGEGRNAFGKGITIGQKKPASLDIEG
jgi:hypothetical protein